jgi:hypothetical protein
MSTLIPPLQPSGNSVDSKIFREKRKEGSIPRQHHGKENRVQHDLPPPSSSASFSKKSDFSVEVLDPLVQTEEQAALLSKAAKLRKELAETQRQLGELDGSSEPLKLGTAASNMPRALAEAVNKGTTTPSKIERSRYRTVRFFQDYKKAGRTAQIVQAIFCLVILSVTIFIDGVAFILASISEEILLSKLRSGILKDLAIDTVQGVLADPVIKAQAIKLGSDLIEAYGEKAAVTIVALLRNKETLSALEDGLVGMLESNDLKKGIDGFVNSKSLRKTIRKFIGQQGGALLGLAKGVLSDEELEHILSAFAAKFVADITTGTASGVAKNVKDTVKGYASSVQAGASSVKGAVKVYASSARASVRSKVLGGLSKLGAAFKAARQNADEYAASRKNMDVNREGNIGEL